MAETGASLRVKADAAVRAGHYTEASDLYHREAAIYRANGDVNGAKVEEVKADEYASEIRLYAELPADRPPTRSLPKSGALAKWEPEYGCYLGGFMDRDERLGEPFMDENEQTHCDPDQFGTITGKKHATVFCYVAYGKRFPTQWTSRLRGQNVAAHIAWEPNDGLDPIQDDEYLNTFAQDAARARCPIFLRYASEMNGDWTRYGGDAERYIEKWRLVKMVMDRHAPNVAMVWCVNTIPEPPIAHFYPGDDFVDWVGVNFYSVPFHDNDPKHPGLFENPADNLKYVYDLYAAKKPVMACEFGASHHSALETTDRSEWASRKISELYASLPRLYPRVKCVDIFDNDNLKYALPGRQLNNYSVTDSDVVLKAYTKAIAPDYFLSDVVGDWGGLSGTPASPAGIVTPVADSGLSVSRGILRVSTWARCYAEHFTVAYKVNGKVVAEAADPGARDTTLTLPSPGVKTIEIVLLDDRGHVAGQKAYKITVV